MWGNCTAVFTGRKVHFRSGGKVEKETWNAGSLGGFNGKAGWWNEQ